ncbi:MAG: glutamate racemase, partial [Bacilli bacterium]
MAHQAIGILDSGVGGLTVVKELFRQLPRERLVYFGDTSRCPYGPREASEVEAFTYQIINYLLQYNLKMLVIGCNTATAVVFPVVKSRFYFPVVGVINPGARAAIKATKNGRVGVIGTAGTIRSQSYVKALHNVNPDLNVTGLAC